MMGNCYSNIFSGAVLFQAFQKVNTLMPLDYIKISPKRFKKMNKYIPSEKVEKPSDVLKVGDTTSAVVLHIDGHERRIGLSMKGVAEKVEKAEIEKYISNQGPPASTLGELIQEEMERRGGINKKEEE